MYVYIIQAGDKKNAPIKVGVSNNPEKRLKTLQTGNPKILRLLMVFECSDRPHAMRLESTLHQMLRGQGILNEWFSCSRTNVTRALNRLALNKDIAAIKSYDGMFSEQKSRAKTRKELKLQDKRERKILSLKKIIDKKSGGRGDIVYELAEARLKELRSKKERSILREMLAEVGILSGDIKSRYKEEIGSRLDSMFAHSEKVIEDLKLKDSKGEFLIKMIGEGDYKKYIDSNGK